MNELKDHVSRGEEARRRITQRFVEAAETPPTDPDPVAIAAFLTMKSFRHLTDGTLIVSLYVPPHISHETYMTLLPFCKEVPLAISVEQIDPEILQQIVHRDA